MLVSLIQALPLALPIATVAIAVGAYAALRYADGKSLVPSLPKSSSRHRMTRAAAADPHRRDWAAIAAERISGSPSDPDPGPLPKPKPKPTPVAYDPLDPRVPLAEVERRMRVDALTDRIEEMREVAPMWSWSNEKTDELVAAP